MAACAADPSAAPAPETGTTAAIEAPPDLFDVGQPSIFTFSALLEGVTASREDFTIPIPEGMVFTPSPRLISAQRCDLPDAPATCPAAPRGSAALTNASHPTTGPGPDSPETGGVKSLSIDKRSLVRPARWPVADGQPPPQGGNGAGTGETTLTPKPPAATAGSTPGSNSGGTSGSGGTASPGTSGGIASPAPAPAPDVTIPVKNRAALGTLAVAPRLAERAKAAGAGTLTVSQVRQLETRAGTVTAPIDGAFSYTAERLILARRLTVVSAPLTATQVLRFSTGTVTATATYPSALGQRTTTCEALTIVPPVKADESPQGVCVLPDFSGTAPRLTAGLRITSSSRVPVVSVPERYLRNETSGDNVVVTRVTGTGTEESIPVVVGAGDGVRRVIVSGVRPGDRLKAMG